MDDKYDNSIIFYNEKVKSDYNKDPSDLYSFNKRDLTDELHQIIKYHNYLPSKLKHNESSITKIIFEHEKILC
jgi:hypothetical protein